MTHFSQFFGHRGIGCGFENNYYSPYSCGNYIDSQYPYMFGNPINDYCGDQLDYQQGRIAQLQDQNMQLTGGLMYILTNLLNILLNKSNQQNQQAQPGNSSVQNTTPATAQSTQPATTQPAESKTKTEPAKTENVKKTKSSSKSSPAMQNITAECGTLFYHKDNKIYKLSSFKNDGKKVTLTFEEDELSEQLNKLPYSTKDSFVTVTITPEEAIALQVKMDEQQKEINKGLGKPS